jgi:proteasome lid subunit RPN8/RPN11
MKLQIPRLFWMRLIHVLRRRGQRRRESGAFLLGNYDKRKLVEFIPYDDLDPHCLDHGYITFDCKYHVPLLEICRQRGLHVLADVHTHPGRRTGQSEMDRDNPMFSIKGYTELIVPSFGYCSLISFAGVGVHRYDGNGKWFSYRSPNDALEFTLL